MPLMCHSGLKAVTCANSRDLQVQRNKLGMPAFLYKIFLRFLRRANLCQNAFGVTFTEMCAKSTLTFMNV